MSVTWLKLWRHVWQSLKLIVKGIDTSSTGFKMEVLEEINLSSHDAVIEAYDFSDISSICDVGGGRERTVDEYKALLDSVGIAVSKVVPTNRGPALLECTV